MRIPRLYTPQAIELNQEFLLEEQSAHHVATVLRIKKGREVVLFNGDALHGKQGEFTGIISQIDRKKVSVICHKFIEKNTLSPISIHLGACLIKNDRMDWLIQKATELGVNGITPLFSENTDIKLPEDRLAKKLAHWQQVMINACEQCGRTDLVNIHSPQQLKDYICTSQAELKLFLHPNTNKDTTTIAKPRSIELLVGPEGGFSQEEVEWATANTFQTLSLGPRILRAETAPLAAISVLQSQFGDF